MRTTPLIEFPSDGSFEDSGEGGTFCLLIVPAPRGSDTPDDRTGAGEITVMAPDTYVAAPGLPDEFWTPIGFTSRHKPDWCVLRDAAKELGGNGRADLAGAVTRARSRDDFSLGVQAALRLGSTERSLWNPKEGVYWAAGETDLTPAGRALYDGLRAAYGVTPVILTGLDT